MVEVSSLTKKEDLQFSREHDANAEKDVKFVSAPAYISSVPPWSLAHEIGLEPGDQILEINNHKLRDLFDFKYHFEQAEEVLLLVKRGEEIFEIELEKDPDDELGAEFTTPLFNGVQECANKCPFCFIENQPFDTTRETLQLRDDDFRLSYLHGSYVTLTNLSFSDRKRIEALRPGPLYISVHATDPEIRDLMLGRKKSIPILDELKWLDSLDIPVHTQIVLCPGMNDGKHLLKTINDLFQMRNKPVRSVAIVPVGLTKYHRAGLRRFELDEALEVINMIESWEQEKSNRKNFVFLSDEFYLMTHTPVPEQDYYGDYPQLEDGVGMTRLFLNEVDASLRVLEEGVAIQAKRIAESPSAPHNHSRRVTWINGTISRPIVEKVAERINARLPGIELKALCLDSIFWGVTNVSGLLTGDDIYQALKYIPKEMLGEMIIIPKVMLKDGYDIFLDDMHLSELEAQLGIPCVKAWGAEELIMTLTKLRDLQLEPSN
jgi:putative radical SAM enzyme (TIGR03279 family)